MSGTQSDIAARVYKWLPTQWFPAAPAGTRIGAMTQGAGAALAINYGQIAYTQLQTRVATLTDGWVDLASGDYLGSGTLPRRTNESDASYQLRIRLAVFAIKNTRAAVIQAVENLTGLTPWFFGPATPGDTGGYNVGGLAYGTGGVGGAGGYGSLELPYQFFMVVQRPNGAGIAGVGGYYGSGYHVGAGGYGVGSMEYITLSQSGENVTDALIYSTITSVISAGVTAWVRLTNEAPMPESSAASGTASLIPALVGV